MAIVARAYEIYSAFTTAAGSAEQIIQVNSTGVTLVRLLVIFI